MAYRTSRARQTHLALQPNHSPTVQVAIDAAFDRLRQATCEVEKAAIHEPLDAYLAAPMSREQRMDVSYLLGECCDAQDGLLWQSCVIQGSPQDARYYFEDALSIAHDLPDWVALADIAERLGSYCRCTESYGPAIAYHRLALDTLRDPKSRIVARDIARECRLVAHLASHKTISGDAAAAEELFAEAEHLSNQIAEPGLEQGVLAWGRAVLYQFQGKYDTALHHAELATNCYAQHGNPSSFGRIQVFTAKLALTVAESCPSHSSARAHHMDRARRYTNSPAVLESLEEDPAGKSLHLLSMTHFLRLAGDTAGLMPHVLNVARGASESEDAALESLALAELAGDMTSLGEASSARSIYVRALQALRNTGMDGHASEISYRLRKLDGWTSAN